MANAFSTSEEERRAILIAIIVSAFAYQAHSGLVTIGSLHEFIAIGTAAVLVRELGQRTVAEYIDAKVQVELSREGLLATVFGGLTAALSGLPVIILFPLTSRFEAVEYSQWGKSIRGAKMRREFWLASGGIVALYITAVATSVLGLGELPDYLLIFAAFQLVPFDHEDLPAGLLDGVYILRQNGLYWLFYTFTILVTLALV